MAASFFVVFGQCSLLLFSIINEMRLHEKSRFVHKFILKDIKGQALKDEESDVTVNDLYLRMVQTL